MASDAFERIEIPTPFHIGSMNSYLFYGSGSGSDVTLLDPGPATKAAYETVSAHLEGTGYEVADVDRILVTHPHMDHFGLADHLASAADADVFAHPNAIEPLADPSAHLAREQAFFEPFLTSMGVPSESVGTMIELPEPYTTFREPVTVDRELTDGDVVDVGTELTAVHTPGHAPGSICFVDPEDGTTFTGDHVLSEISPNPLLTLEPGTTDTRTRSLPTYLDSLERLLELDVDLARGYGGHRGTIADVGARSAEIIDHHREREESFADLLEQNGPMTAYELLQERFPDLPATELFPGMSEVIGHLDLLEDDGRVEILESNDGLRYALD